MEKTEHIAVNGDIFMELIQTSVTLFDEIIEKGKHGGHVSEAEAEWANAFIEYADALKLVDVKNNDSDE